MVDHILEFLSLLVSDVDYFNSRKSSLIRSTPTPTQYSHIYTVVVAKEQDSDDEQIDKE